MDRELEHRVWQRVRGQDTAGEELGRLLRLSAMQAEDLRHLDRELHRREKITLGLLAGVHRLWGGGPVPGIGQTRPLPRVLRLRRCRERCREMLLLCVRLEQHPRYGSIFTDLTRWQRAACEQLEQMR